MNNQAFDWVPFYGELAEKLLPFKSNRSALIGKVKDIYKISGINIPTLESGDQIVDMDPFTVFGLFNKKLTDANRILILTAIVQIFGITAPVPQSFSSLPVLNPQNATFYPFLPGRKETDIPELWDLFEPALLYAKEPTDKNRNLVEKHFDTAVNIKYNGNSKITMGLYWIAPHAFLNLDQRNTWYIYESGKIPKEIVQSLPAVESKIPSVKYFDIVEKIHAYLVSGRSTLKDFKELSSEAWLYSEEVNKLNAQKAKIQQDDKEAGLADEDVSTIRYWMYSPGEFAVKWEEFYQAGIMAIGWDEIGDLSLFASKQEMKQRMKETMHCE